jgi:UDP-N-acetylglucosamine kinase
MTDEEITAKAIIYAKSVKKTLAKAMIDHLPEEESAVSVFMAGSPGPPVSG